MPEQLPLAVQLPDDEVFDSFVVGNNTQLLSHLRNLLNDEPSGIAQHLTFISGEQGAGKSHLLYALCHEAQLLGKGHFYLGLRQSEDLPVSVLSGLEHLDLLCIDDVDSICHHQEWQVGLFDLINRVRETGTCRLVFTALQGPASLPISLPDLKSRLTWGIAYHLHAPDDQTRVEALTRRAERRGLHISRDVSRFLITHCRQDMAAVMAALDKLDASSLQTQRKLTIPFVKTVLGI